MINNNMKRDWLALAIVVADVVFMSIGHGFYTLAAHPILIFAACWSCYWLGQRAGEYKYTPRERGGNWH